MIAQKALRFGGLAFAITLGLSVAARADTSKQKRAWQGIDGWLAQDSGGAPAQAPAGSDAKASTNSSTDFKITRQDGSTVTGRVHDKGDSLVVDTPQGPVEVPKADISAIRAAPAEAPAAAPAATPTDKPADKPAETPAATPADKPADKPAETPAATPADKPSDKPAETPADKPMDKPAETPAANPADKPVDKPAETPADKPMDKPAETPAANPADKPAETPAANPADKPADKPTGDVPPTPADKPADKPADVPPATPVPGDQGTATAPVGSGTADAAPVTSGASDTAPVASGDTAAVDSAAGEKPKGTVAIDQSEPAGSTEPVSTTAASSGPRTTERPLYPGEEAEFGPVLPDHRGVIELSPYGGWNFISHGLGTPSGGEAVAGTRLSVNFGKDDTMAVDLDWKFSRPEIRRRQATDTNGNVDSVNFRLRQTINWGNVDFTYRLRFLRIEYLTPYVSAGVGVVVFDKVNKYGTVTTTGGQQLTAHVHQPLTLAPSVNIAVGLDYKLDPNWAIRIEAKDEILFTNYNDSDHGSPVINSFSATAGIIWAIDW